MMSRRLSSLAISVLLIFPLLGTEYDAFKQEGPFILVNVLDRRGKPVVDLSKENFQVRCNGKNTTVLDAHYSVAPRRIVVLFDMSGSMAGNDSSKWQIANEALSDLLTITTTDVPIALVTFSDGVHIISGFEQGRRAITEWINQKKTKDVAQKRTALFDAMATAVHLLDPPRAGDTIYAITDGGDNASHVSARMTREGLLASGIRLFAFVLAEPNQGPEYEGMSSLVQLATDTGGFIFGVTSTSLSPGLPSYGPSARYEYNDRVRDTIKSSTYLLNLRVHGFYVLRFGNSLSRKTNKIKADILGATGSPRKDVSFTYTRVILPAR
jgi:von Willebrand factor type A domain